MEQDDSFVQSSTQESVGVEDVRWGGFDCEKITRVTGTENDLSAGMKAIGDLFGTKSSMDNSIKDLNISRRPTSSGLKRIAELWYTASSP